MDKIYHGWYSEKQKNIIKFDEKGDSNKFSFHIYLNESGEEVEVTEVSLSPQYTSDWDDVIYKGCVIKWVRSIKHGDKNISF